jgi:murein L,D-transpeptidase YcbB/YkuD
MHMSNKQLIYNLLRNAGITEAGALGILGNWQAESGCEPNRLQNDFSSYRTASKDYTARVTSGAISRQEFARDQKGYGLAQWTYFNFQTGQGRKLNLYDFWKKSGKALDDVTMQVAFALHEMTTEGQYAKLLALLKTTNDIYTATDQVCRIYEQPYYCNVGARFEAANKIKYQINLNEWGQASEPVPVPASDPEPAEDSEPCTGAPTVSEFWPPRVVDKNMHGPDVEVLQAVLKARGYISTNPDGIFGSYLEDVVKRFQTDAGLQPDGVVGPMTWGKLLERG